jgi:hypothetical protein
VAVGRRHPPGDDVGAVVQRGEREGHRRPLAVEVLGISRVDRLARGVEHAHEVVAQVDGFTEVEHHLVRSGGEVLARGGLGRDQLGVRVGARRIEDQRQRRGQRAGRRRHEPPPSRTAHATRTSPGW